MRSLAITSLAISAFAFATAAPVLSQQKNPCAIEGECDRRDGFAPSIDKNRTDNDDVISRDPAERKVKRVRQAQSKDGWRYDRDRHRRKRNRDTNFRFYFNGFFYPEPYWLNDGYIGSPYRRRGIARIGCAEGREIVADRGYRRVRTVECSGRVYTYTASRNGRLFRFQVDARDGDVISRRAI